MSEACRAMKAWSLGAVFLMAFAGGIQAAPGPEVKIRLTGSIPDHAGGGASWVTLKDGSKVAPGGKILYKVELSNSGRQAATQPSALGPIPAGTSYVPGTASTAEGLQVEFSLDGGKSFAEKPTVTILGKDGKPQTVPAPPERITTIRWSWQAPLAAGATSVVSYQVQVR